MYDSKVSKTDKTLKDVKCVVDSCYYNTRDGKCQASKIEVAPEGSPTNESISCVTYESRDK